MAKSYEFSKAFAKDAPLFKGFKALAFTSLDEAKCQEVLRLRNEKRVRLSSKFQGEISYKAHKDFVKHSKDFFYAFYEDDCLLGVCSLVRLEKDSCFLGIYTKTSCKIPHLLLKASFEIARRLGVKTIKIEVRLENSNAKEFFKRAGFVKTGEDLEYEFYKLDLV